MTGQTSFRLVLPSLELTGHAVSLLRYGVSRIVEHFLDLRERHLLRIVVDVNGLGWDINLDLAHTPQFSNRSLDGVLAMLARNVGGHKGRRFHNAYPPLIQVNHLERKLYNSSHPRCSRSELKG